MQNILINKISGHENPLTNNEELICKRALAALHTHYPGYPWGAEINAAMLTIRNKFLGNWGYRINLLVTTNIELEAKMAGGECLDRFNQRRGAANYDNVKAHPADAKGSPKPIIDDQPYLPSKPAPIEKPNDGR